MKKKDIHKTNAMRILEESGIDYIPHEIELDDQLDAITVASKLGADQDEVFKTLVTKANTKEYFVFMIPGAAHLSLKKAAKAAGVKSIEMIPQKELFPLTGYVHGGCSPLGMKKSFPTFADETALIVDRIFFSAGKIGMQIETDPVNLEKLSIQTADLCEE